MEEDPNEIPSTEGSAGDGTQQTGPLHPAPPAREGELLPVEAFSALATRYPGFFGGENRAQVIAHIVYTLEQEKRGLSLKIDSLQSQLDAATKTIHDLQIESATSLSQTKWRPAATAGGLLLISTIQNWNPRLMGVSGWIVLLVGIALAIYGLWPQKGAK